VDTLYIFGIVRVYVCMFLRPIGGQTAGPIETKLGIRIHLDRGIVLDKPTTRLRSEHRRRENGGRGRRIGTEAGRTP